MVNKWQKNNRNKLTFLFSSSIQSFGYWIEQLIGESLGKDGSGEDLEIEGPLYVQTAVNNSQCRKP